MDMSSGFYNNRKFDFLRPGSLIHYYTHHNSRWNVIKVDRALLEQFKQTHDFDGPYRPIFLTDYWMGRFGFEETGDFYRLGDIKIWRDLYMLIPLEERRVNLRSVHELQNYYRERTHSELSLPGKTN